MKGLKTRAISAVFFVLIMVGGIYGSEETALLLISAICILCLKEFYQITLSKEENQNTRVVLYTIVGFFIFFFTSGFFGWSNFPANDPPPSWFFLIPILPSLFFIFELYKKSPIPFENLGIFAAGLIYIAIPISFISDIAFLSDPYPFLNYHPNILMGILLLIWSNDTFAYLVGSQFGKNKLFPRISPGKTWEGTIGGGLCTILVSIALFYLFGKFAMKDWIIIGLICSVFGTIGDLVESMLKRSKGIKDSGNIMPGHGGALDRFDAFIFVLPFIWFYLKL